MLKSLRCRLSVVSVPVLGGETGTEVSETEVSGFEGKKVEEKSLPRVLQKKKKEIPK